jgi:hypothetical protein
VVSSFTIWYELLFISFFHKKTKRKIYYLSTELYDDINDEVWIYCYDWDRGKESDLIGEFKV